MRGCRELRAYTCDSKCEEKLNEFVYELIGTEGVIRYDRGAKSFIMRNSRSTCNLEFDHEKNFEAVYEEWAKSLRTGKSDLLTSAEAGMKVTDIAREATNEAIRNRKSS